TAAAFALSMNNATVMPTGAAEKNVTVKVPSYDDYDPSKVSYAPLYGPPPEYYDTTTTVEDIVTTTNMMTYPAYGTIQPYTTTTTEDIISITTSMLPQPAYGAIQPYTTTTTEDVINLTTRMTSTVYGPPAWFTSTTTTEDIINTTTTMTYPVYGVMQIFGDLNWDEKTDVFDLITLRKAILNNEYRLEYDVNDDGEVGIADLISLQNFILGRYTTRDEMYNPEIPDVTTLIETFTTTTAVLYGPPWVFPDYTGTIPDWALNPTTQTTVEEE
ncbi:MAG: dockerin type I repeat-containing protein, partial [Ruminococcus sp.]|nr:dockerin type I repeat-containing protein [Ruminococcus sp.]